jgi:hypothetical protein
LPFLFPLPLAFEALKEELHTRDVICAAKV